MGDERTESIDMEKDLGVHIHKSLKEKEQVNYVVEKVDRILGTIHRAYTDKSMKNIKNLYITLVINENGQQAWYPHQKDIDKLESVQWRATKMITGICKLPPILCKTAKVCLQDEDRRKRADMLEVFKIIRIINGFTDIDTNGIFELNHTPRPGRHNKSIV